MKNIDELNKWLSSLKKISKDYSLEKMNKLDEIFDFPTKKVKFIHVAGTNGKGSIVKGLQAILIKSGFNVGTLISPHMICYNERVTYNNLCISDEEFIEITNYIISKYDVIKETMEELSFSEFITILGFIYFVRKKVDIAIIEVGLGGLLDPTNIIKPICAIIGQIDYDHCQILGFDISDVAKNKLGIVKEEVPLITFDDLRINDLVFNKVQEKNCPLTIVNKDNIKVIKFDNYTHFNYQNKNYKTSLLGFHQAENMTLVVEAISVLNEKYNFNITNDIILDGLTSIIHLGRMQVVQINPYVILDGAHNHNGMKRLVEFINQIKGNKKVVFILAISQDKDSKNMMKEVSKVANEVYFTYFFNCLSPIYIQEMSVKNEFFTRDQVHAVPSFKNVNFDDKGSIYVICGSLYFIRDVLMSLK